jgi:glycosyltransferase involved in cell wall biosynthesis
MIDLSVIVVSARPKWLANCLSQYQAQKFHMYDRWKAEVIVVGEHEDETAFSRVITHYKPDKYIHKAPQGYAGAFGKDVGLKEARGEYVCFWDDDNIYYPGALDALFSAVWSFDIGVVQCGMMAMDFKVIPEGEEITFGNIDTMCLCVRRELALTARWADHRGVGTDYAWVKKLLRKNPSVNFLNDKIGEHLDE